MYSGFGAHGWICVSLCGRLVLFIGKATTILGEFGRVFLAVKKTSSFQLRLRGKLTKEIFMDLTKLLVNFLGISPTFMKL